MFRELKKRFTKELVLAALDLNKKNKNESRLDHVTRGMLFIECENG